VINNGELILVEDKAELMRKLGKKRLTLQLHGELDEIPSELAGYGLELAAGGTEVIYTYDTQTERTGITALLADLNAVDIRFKDLRTEQSSLVDIFFSLVKESR
jgi:ABC-2 type transport system ATP-binding protein